MVDEFLISEKDMPNLKVAVDVFVQDLCHTSVLNFGSYLVIFVPNIKTICIFFVFYRKSFLGSLSPEISFFSRHLSPRFLIASFLCKK